LALSCDKQLIAFKLWSRRYFTLSFIIVSLKMFDKEGMQTVKKRS